MDEIISSEIIQNAEMSVYKESEKKGLSLWDRFGVDVPHIKWEDFLPVFIEYLGLPEDADRIYNLQFECVRMILGAREPPHLVYQTYFKLFVLWFGPISDKNGIEVLEFVKTLLQQEWFFGILPEEQAIEKINTHGKAGCYLVRFSSKQACFTLTYLDLKK